MSVKWPVLVIYIAVIAFLSTVFLKGPETLELIFQLIIDQ